MLEDDAYVKIKEMIVEGDLPGGSVLSEAELCKKLEMSRTPVRVAINRLDIEGLVTQTKGHFSTVRLITPDDICDFFQIALIAEEYVVRTVCAQPDKLDAQRAAACIDAQKAAVQASDSYAATKADHGFHMTLYAALDNRELMQSMEKLWMKTQLALNPRIRRTASTVGADSIQEHQAILESLANHASVEESLSAVRTHNNNARNRMLLR